MKTLVYCYGPFSLQKDRYCEQFIKENNNYSLVSCHQIRKKLSGSCFIKEKTVELKVISQVNEECLKILNKKNKNLLINGLFLTEASRMTLLNKISEGFDQEIKKAAVAFLPTSATSTLESLKETKDFKDVDFEDLRKQFFNFKLAEKQEEGDLLISKIEKYSDKFSIEAKIWGKEEIISCTDLKKVSEFIKHIRSF
jgi:hypothetical protein